MPQQFNTENTLEEQIKTGIYSITNLITNKFYIGSTRVIGKTYSCSGFYIRWYQHIRELRNQEHGNKYLQRSWNKHGADNFKFQILEFVEPDKCIEVEQTYLDLFPEGDREIVYNTCFIAGCPNSGLVSEETRRKMSESSRGLNAKSFYVVSPEGEEIHGFNLTEFSNQNNLKTGNLFKAIKGIISNYKGWTKDLEAHYRYKEAYLLRGIKYDKRNKTYSVGHCKNGKEMRESFKTFDDAVLARDILEENGYKFQVKVLNKQFPISLQTSLTEEESV